MPDSTQTHMPSIEALYDFARKNGVHGDEIDFENTTVLQQVHVSRLLPDPNNMRKTMKSIREMADSIGKREKILNPLKISAANGQPGMGVVDRGNRRLLGKLLRLWQAEQDGTEESWEVPCLVIPAEQSPQERALDNIVDNLETEEVPPMEQAQGFRDYMDVYGLSIEELAEKAGGSISEQSIRARLCLLNLATQKDDGFEVLQHFIDGRIPTGDAQNIGRLPRDQQRLVAVQVVRKELTGNDLAQEVSRILGTSKGGNRISASSLEETTESPSGHGGITSLGGFGSRLGVHDPSGNGNGSAYQETVRTFELAKGTPNHISVSVKQKESGKVQVVLESHGAIVSDEITGRVLQAVGKQLLKTPAPVSQEAV